jgi:TPR repeat protein
MYLQGQGVSRDPVQAYKWFKLAQLGGDEEAAKNLDAMMSTMTKEQVDAGKNLVKESHPQIPVPASLVNELVP